MTINNTYKYTLYLQAREQFPLLQNETSVYKELSPTLKSFEFVGPPSVIAPKLNQYICYVQDMFKDYILTVVGEHEGHVEIYKSEDTSFKPLIAIMNGTEPIILWS